MGSLGEAVTQEGSYQNFPGGKQIGQHDHDHARYLIWLVFANWQFQKHAQKCENRLSKEHEKMMGIPGLGKELEDVDKALSAGDLSFRFVGVALSLLCGEVSTKSARYTNF